MQSTHWLFCGLQYFIYTIYLSCPYLGWHVFSLYKQFGRLHLYIPRYFFSPVLLSTFFGAHDMTGPTFLSYPVARLTIVLCFFMLNLMSPLGYYSSSSCACLSTVSVSRGNPLNGLASWPESSLLTAGKGESDDGCQMLPWWFRLMSVDISVSSCQYARYFCLGFPVLVQFDHFHNDSFLFGHILLHLNYCGYHSMGWLRWNIWVLTIDWDLIQFM